MITNEDVKREVKAMLDREDSANRIIGESEKNYMPSKFVERPYCDATEAQARRKAVDEFRKRFDIAMENLRLDIEENGKTIPVITNEAYAKLNAVQFELGQICRELITQELSNINVGK